METPSNHIPLTQAAKWRVLNEEESLHETAVALTSFGPQFSTPIAVVNEGGMEVVVATRVDRLIRGMIPHAELCVIAPALCGHYLCSDAVLRVALN